MDELEQEIDGVARTSGFSGAVRVDRGGELVLAKAYGLAHRGYGIPNEVDTRFAHRGLNLADGRADGIWKLVLGDVDRDHGGLAHREPVDLGDGGWAIGRCRWLIAHRVQ